MNPKPSSNNNPLFAEFLKHDAKLRRYARSLVRNSFDRSYADDLVQDTYARACTKIHLWKPDTDLRAWLFTILHNTYVNWVRSATRATLVPLEHINSNHGSGGPDSTRIAGRQSFMPERGTIAPNQIYSVSLAELRVKMTKLPPEMHQAIMLVGLEGLRYEEAAEVLGVPVGTVRSRLSRGRDMLMEMMASHETTKRADALTYADVV